VESRVESQVEGRDGGAAVPRAKIAGWVPLPGRMPEAGEIAIPPLLRDQPLFADLPSLFAACPDVELIVDITPDARHLEHMRSCAPANLSLCSSGTLLRFCAPADEICPALDGVKEPRPVETLFTLLAEQVEDDILVLDNTGVILDTNRRAAEIWGMARGVPIGKTCAELDRAANCCCADEGVCPFMEARDTGKRVERAFSRVMPDGRLRSMHAWCFPVNTPPDAPERYLCIRRDVTEKHFLEQRLQQTEKMAAIGELSTYMAHEIRNPLFSIGGFANALLRNPTLNEMAREKARIIYDESRRLDLILASILNFARPSEQVMRIFEPGLVIRQTLDLMTMGSEERGIRVETEIEPHLPKAQGNAENLKQCLINIVKNALEAMPEKGILSVAAKRAGDFVRIDVADTGKGIPPDIQDQVFSPFFSTKHGGAGLGLAMTRKLIEEMGGKVLLESAPGRGTRLSLLLPAALAVQDAADENHALASAGGTRTPGMAADAPDGAGTAGDDRAGEAK
jgi:PAS domain S-box-containing protein